MKHFLSQAPAYLVFCALVVPFPKHNFKEDRFRRSCVQIPFYRGITHSLLASHATS